MPLTLDNTWNYNVSYDVTFTGEDGTDAREPQHRTASEMRQITGVDTIAGREYVVETFIATAAGEPPVVSWRRLRQDRDALYQADVASIPPGEIPPDAVVVDQVRLRFPIAAGATWRLRPDSDAFVLTVEALETLPLAIGNTPAWRVRVDGANAGPDDYTRLWYGAEGLLRREIHTEFDAVDAVTDETVHVVTHSVEGLVSLQLMDP
jgi:hypothetical protein